MSLITLLFIFCLLPYCQSYLSDVRERDIGQKYYMLLNRRINSIKAASENFCDRIPVEGKQTLAGYEVCYDMIEPPSKKRKTGDEFERRKKMFVSAIIQNKNLCKREDGGNANEEEVQDQDDEEDTHSTKLKCKGASPTAKSRNWVKKVRNICGCDQSGHIIAQSLGGLGDEYNIFPQNSQLNRADWYQQEAIVRKHVKAHPDNWALMEIAFQYTDKDYKMRPSSFLYRFSLSEDHNAIHTRAVMGMFLNQDHTFVEVKQFVGKSDDGMRYSIYLVDRIDDFHSKDCNLPGDYDFSTIFQKLSYSSNNSSVRL